MPSGASGSPDTDARLIDLRGIGATLRQRQWPILVTIAVVLVLTAIAYLMLPQRFTATATVALDRRVDELVGQQSGDAALPTDSPSVDTAVQVLTSPQLAGEVADRLKLADVVGFGRIAGQPVSPPAVARQRATNVVRSGLLVKRTGVSYAITVSYSGNDAARAAAIVNQVVDQYIEDQRTGKEGARNAQTTLLRDRLVGLRRDVINAEQAVANYRARTNLIDVEKDSTAVQQEISVLNTQLATAEAERAAAQARLSAARATGAGGPQETAALGALRGQRAQLGVQRADLAGRYGPLHPDLARIDRQIADIDRTISTESGRVRANLAAEASVANGRVAAIRSSLNAAQGGLTAGNAASVQLAELVRNADSARSLYQAFLDRYRQSVAGQGTDQSNAYVISHAMVPGAPDFPSLPLFAVGGLLAGLLAAGALVLVLELLERGLKSRREFEAQMGIPVIGTVADLRSVPGTRVKSRDPMGPADYLVGNEGSVFGEAFRSIRTALRLGYPDQRVRSLAVTSALPNEGKTTTSICLARSAAMAGHKVVLVDCDVRRRASSRSLTSGVQHGLTDVLKGSVPLDQALVHDAASGAYVLAQSAQVTGDYDLIASPAMETLIAQLSDQFDLVVLDTAPVLPLAEARAIAGMADGVLMVARWRKTPAQAISLALDLLGRAGARVQGAAMTMVDLKAQARGGRDDEMVYYKQFKAYYT
ncbi:capsular exopolysaccharide family [Sphingomonas gellani]|uniref:non-specific protein-tyrosine kinase n=1 Tax=Sphingomonas gellani TaxID=1166340 RepID=A0A1H8HUN1_9SPHN|nr:capsular exopolysaccharide family [Sphingomonas gellani]